MRGYRSKLRAVKRQKKNGVTYWAARGFVPIRRPDGSFARRRVEISIGGDTATARQVEIDRLNDGYEDRAERVPLTFSKAYTNYIEANFPVPLYAERILAHIGVRQCHEIDDSVMNEARKHLFKPDAKASYVNRHLYTPVIAVLNMALTVKPKITRPNGHKESPPVIAPDAEWYKLTMPFMGPDTLALVSFLTLHGRRLGDALGRKPGDLNVTEGLLTVDRTKNGDALSIHLHPRCAQLIGAMDGWEKRRWLFRDGPGSGSNARKDIMVACLRASGYATEEAEKIAAKPTKHRDEIAGMSVPYFSPHELGRHAFARRMLMAGYSLQYVKEAGGWKSIEVLSRLYGHLEKKEWTRGVHQVADAFMGSFPAIHGGGLEALPPSAAAT